MNAKRLIPMAGVALVALLASSCSGGSSEAGATQQSPTPTADPGAVSTSTPFPLGLDPANFTDPVNVDNAWWPMKPGTRWILEGEALDGDERIERRVITTITDLTKQIGGIDFIVGYELDYNDDVLAESELFFAAEDDEGNIWHMGEYAELWDEGQLDGGQAWIPGYLEGAKPGIRLPADPAAEGPAYAQGFAPPPFYWDDRGQFKEVVEEVCVPAGCYPDVVVIREFEPTIPNVAQLKYWAPGVGNIKVGWEGEDEEQEVLELVEVAQLSSAEMDEVRELALAMETRASLYGMTSPVQRRT